MKACGLIVEYNPFHNGHKYHFESSKEKTNADVTVAVMSGSFLQRGEPAIIDKFHRTKAALSHGVDIIIELPFVYAVQYADLFAHGSVQLLSSLGVDTVCFGSEEGSIEPFKDAYKTYIKNEKKFKKKLHENLDLGQSFPTASRNAYDEIGLVSNTIDLGQPNNILGFSYVKAAASMPNQINVDTIQRTKSGYHDPTINEDIASATSIRKEIISVNELTKGAIQALPDATIEQLKAYQRENGQWHDWSYYFPFLRYLIETKSIEELQQIHGMEEGLEYRMKQTIKEADDFEGWMKLLKTKRYTWTRIQRVLTHLLTNTKKEEIESIKKLEEAPYIRILGMSKNGREFIQQQKKQLDQPLIANLQEFEHPMLQIEERASDAYYSVLSSTQKKRMKKQELTGPILL
ncbi:nucleotidyltransferase [Halalkalibacillus sediminis]|uniref:tRNA(Met) cytidine acetate ligase n=1 Tax=Halalkalibacillus sediminis TaxID=2018042 RepID=A0A2I0QW02_9BACI|nr:nucleotidyltransferase [Halalkalibacillus sediminis]PKR78521.1 nucleotidyltransferase [Halalkalibacillus sediminis]